MALGFRNAPVVARGRAVLEADNRGLGSGMKDAEKTFDRHAKAIEHRSELLSKAMHAGFVAAAGAVVVGIGAMAGALKVGFGEFEEGQKVAAQTVAVLKSTGAVAGVSAKQIDSLAGSMMRKTGIDDEAIKSGENLLLTFTNIRNEAGKGNDVFTQSTRVMADMSVALGQDMKTSAIQLGKALNDPIKGVSALQRVGVSFTAAQKEQIKALVASGKGMEAQKLILKELRREFGGSADAAGKTFAGRLNVLKETLKNTAGEMVGKMIPSLTKFVGWIGGIVPKLQAWVTTMVQKVGPTVSKVIGGAVEWFRKVGPVVLGIGKKIVDNLLPVIRSIFTIAKNVAEKVGDVFEKNRAALERIADRVSKAYRAIASVVLPVLRFVFTEVLPRVLNIAIKAIDKVSAAIEAIVGAIRHFVTNARTIFAAFFTWLKETALKAALAVVEPFSHLPSKMGEWARKAKDSIKTELDKIKDDAATAGSNAASSFTSGFSAGMAGFPVNPFAPGAGSAPSAPGNANASAQAGGTQFSLVANAKRFGVGSGAIYGKTTIGSVTGVGGNRVFDCSAYVYAVYTDSGFQGFPGTSETQWATASGSNWTSERISRSDAKPGDVVFMVGSPKYPSPGHVGIVTSGSGSSATVMQYSSTGSPASTVPLGSIGDLVGVKRFYLVEKKDGPSTPSTQPRAPQSTTPDATPKFTPHEADDFSKPSGPSSADKAAKKAESAAKSAAKKAAAVAKRTREKIARDALKGYRQDVADANAALSAHGYSGKALDNLGVTALYGGLGAALGGPDPAEAQKAAHVIVKKRADAERTAIEAGQRKYEQEVAQNADTLRAHGYSSKKLSALGPSALYGGLSAILGGPDPGEAQKRADAIVRANEKAAKDAARREAQAIKGAAKKVAQAVKEAKSIMDAAASNAGTQFERLARGIGDVFDAATARNMPGSRFGPAVDVGGFSIREGDLTPSEQKIKDLQDAHEAAARARERAALEVQIAAETDPQALADLKQRKSDLDYQDTLDALQKQADAERKAADEKLADARDAYQKDRDAQKTALDNKLADLKDALGDGKITLSKYRDEIKGIFDTYGVAYDRRGRHAREHVRGVVPRAVRHDDERD
jgi:ethanolamine utilization microcompartment shell protein EutL